MKGNLCSHFCWTFAITSTEHIWQYLANLATLFSPVKLFFAKHFREVEDWAVFVVLWSNQQPVKWRFIWGAASVMLPFIFSLGLGEKPFHNSIINNIGLFCRLTFNKIFYCHSFVWEKSKIAALQIFIFSSRLSQFLRRKREQASLWKANLQLFVADI